VTTYEPWLPPTDPNAQTRALPWSPAPEQDPIERTRVWSSSAASRPSNAADAAVEEHGIGRSANRRRVLFAAGGLMLLAGGGIATATAASGRARRLIGATGGGTGGQGAAPVPGSSSAASSHTASAPNAPGSASGSPSGQGSTSSSASASASNPSASASSSGSASDSASHGKVYSKPLYYVDDQGPMAIALTMDDGPDPTYTPQVLEIFRQYGIKATFNMIGEQVGANLSLVREVSAAGHTITNHTWDHADLSQLSSTQVLSQMDRCNDALANANQTPTIFRAPYGAWSPTVLQACAARNLIPVDWSVDPRDWDTANVDTQQIVHTVLRQTRAHSIVLEHDGGGNRRNTVAALKQFIPALLDRGYNFVAM
jgi:peptidoglycan/xylan/chitin deacetylase (PgdA/CDA1 family)